MKTFVIIAKANFNLTMYYEIHNYLVPHNFLFCD
jgi:hypothetical protein